MPNTEILNIRDLSAAMSQDQCISVILMTSSWFTFWRHTRPATSSHRSNEDVRTYLSEEFDFCDVTTCNPVKFQQSSIWCVPCISVLLVLLIDPENGRDLFPRNVSDFHWAT
jgi:hypothetical protein